MYHTNPMFKSFCSSKLGRTVIALGFGALAPATPALVMGDLNAFRVACSAAAGAVVTAIALHFKSEADKAEK